MLRQFGFEGFRYVRFGAFFPGEQTRASLAKAMLGLRFYARNVTHLPCKSLSLEERGGLYVLDT
jgi:hypothetical protein